MTPQGDRPAPLWAGRFNADPAVALWDFTVQREADLELWPYDISVSRAHTRMLHACDIIDDASAAAIGSALDTIEAEFDSGSFVFDPADEDIHMAIERRLVELAGEAGGRIHAARSRNDQVVTDFCLWCRQQALSLSATTDELSLALCVQAERLADVPAPGYTHMQRAQPVTLGHTLLAHVVAFGRDAERFLAARERNDSCPLGAGALATTTLPIDPAMTAAELGFSSSFTNSIDAVSARDFVAELLGAATICAVNLSRLAEEVVLWATEEFGRIELDDAWATGSSMMPQKKNPDVAELSRAASGRVLGAFVSLATITKGLPLAYNRDLQEDKAETFAALRRLELALAAMCGLIATATFDADGAAAAASGGGIAATDLAEALVAAGVPFRQAHEQIGALVGRLVSEGRDLEGVTAEELAAVHPALAECSGEWMSADACIERRRVPGGPHPDSVRQAVSVLQRRIAARRSQ